MAGLRPHARLAPSSAYRWLRCPASVGFIEDGEYEDEAGVPADEGTILHSLCEEALRNGTSPYSFVGLIEKYGKATLEITDKLADMMQEGLDVIDDIPGKLFIERRLDLGRWMPKQFGTMDVGIVNRDLGVVFDWKWGFIPVEAVDNDQARIYLLGFWDNFVRHLYPNLKKFRVIIFQPRAPGGGGEWDVDLDDLLEWGHELKRAARKTYDRDAKFVPGPKQCAYCPGAKNLVCEAYKKDVLSLLKEDFDEMDEEIAMGIPMRLPNTSSLTPERRSHIYSRKGHILKFLDRLGAEMMDDALKGRPVPDYKPIYGRHPARKWVDKEAAEKEMALHLPDDKLYTSRLISPKQFQDLVPERTYQRIARDYVDLGEPKPVLVSSLDRRDPIPTLREEFDDAVDES